MRKQSRQFLEAESLLAVWEVITISTFYGIYIVFEKTYEIRSNLKLNQI
jgi:hypothetical protein